VRAEGDDRGRHGRRRPSRHAGRHRRRPDREGHVRRPGHVAGHAPDGPRDERSRARRDDGRQRPRPPRRRRHADLRPRREGAQGRDRRHRRDAGDGRSPVPEHLSVRHPDRARAERRHERHRDVPDRDGRAVRQLRLARRGRCARPDEETVSALDGVKAAVLLFVAAILQVSIFAQVRILHGGPDVLLVTLVVVALLRGSLLGSIAGFVAGLLVDTATLGSLGLTSLVLTLAGYWIGRYGETTGRDRAHAPFTSVAVITVLFAVGVLVVHFVLGERAPAGEVFRGMLP